MTDMIAVSAGGSAATGRDESPFVGLMPYGEDDGDYFFGRDPDRDLVVANLMASRLTVLFGPSGVGKSSLLRAGVVPQLRGMADGELSYLAAGRAVVVYHNDWAGDPLRALAASLRAAIPPEWDHEELLPPGEPLTVGRLRALSEVLETDIYLLCDQFEEVTLYQTGPSADALAAFLGGVVDAASLPVGILIGIRDDALAKLDRFAAHVPGILENYLRLDHLGPEAAREAIERPIEHYNQVNTPPQPYSIEPGLADELLVQLRTGRVSVVDAGKGGPDDATTIETPFLQLVMTRLWAREPALGSTQLRLQTLNELGGAEGIVRTHLDAVMAELDEGQREIAAQVFRYLVTPSGTKVAHTAETLAYFAGIQDVPALERVLEELAAGHERVLRPVPPPVNEPGPARFEIFHDVMAPAVLDWRRRYVAQRERTEAEQGLIHEREAAREQARATRRSLRRSRALVGGLSILLITSIVAVLVAWRAQRNAEYRADLGSYSQLLTTDTGRAMKSALDAWDKQNNAEAGLAVRTAREADLDHQSFGNNPRGVAQLAVSPDGTRLAAAGRDGILRIFDTASGLETAETDKPDRRSPAMNSASFSPDGKWVLVTGTNSRATVFNAANGDPISSLGETAFYPKAMWVQAGGRQLVLVSASFSADAASEPAGLWDPAHPAQPLRTYGKSGATSYMAAASPDGQRIVTVDNTSKVTVWEALSGRPVVTSPAPLGRGVYWPLFAGANGDRIVAAVMALGGRVYRLTSWSWKKPAQEVERGDAWGRQPTEIVASTDGRHVLGGLDKHASVIDAETANGVAATTTHPDWVNAVALSSDGRWLATAGNDGRARIWRADRYAERPMWELAAPGGSLISIGFGTAASGRVFAAGLGSAIHSWVLPHEDVFEAASGWAVSADRDRAGRALVVGDVDGYLRVWPLDASGAQASSMPLAQGYAGPLGGKSVFTPDGNQIIAAPAQSLSPSSWDWRTNKAVPITFERARGFYLFGSVAVSPDGTTAAAGDRGNQVQLWNIKDRALLPEFFFAGDHDDAITGVAFLGNTRLAAVSTDGTLRVWQRGIGRPIATLGTSGGSSISVLTVSSDGRLAATTAADHTISIWDLGDLTQKRPLKIIDGPVATLGSVAFSPDGRIIAVGASDAAVHLWDWRSGTELGELRRHAGGVNAVIFARDQKRIYSAADDGVATSYACTICEPMRDIIDDVRTQTASE